MDIQVNIGHSESDHEKMIQHTEAVVKSTLGHLTEHITRIEVHLSDENNSGHDKSCMMEARLKGHKPIAVTDTSATIGRAIDGAADKLKSILDHTIGRLSDHEERKHFHKKADENHEQN